MIMRWSKLKSIGRLFLERGSVLAWVIRFSHAVFVGRPVEALQLRGGLLPPIKSAITRWQKIGDENQIALAKAWKISVDDAHKYFVSKHRSHWQRNLCADGDIEPNPGPLRCIFLNVGGCGGTWRAIEEWLSDGFKMFACPLLLRHPCADGL